MSADYHYTIRDLPPNDRPRERLRDQGATSLSNAELLGIVLRVGSGRGTSPNAASFREKA